MYNDYIYFCGSRKAKNKQYEINAYLSDKFNKPVFLTQNEIDKIGGKQNWKDIYIHRFNIDGQERIRIRYIEVIPYYRYLSYRDDVIKYSPFYVYAKYNRRKLPRELIDLILN